MTINSKYFLAFGGLILALSLVACGEKKSEKTLPVPIRKIAVAPLPTPEEMKRNLLNLAPVVVNNCKKVMDQVLASPPPAALWDLKVGTPPCTNNPSICNDLLKLTNAYSYADYMEDRNSYKVAEQKRDDILAHPSNDPAILSDQIAKLHNECFGHVKKIAENIHPMMQSYSELEKKGSTP